MKIAHKSVVKVAAVALVVTMMAACAEKPKEVEVAPPVAEAPKPTPVTPAPKPAPVTPAPVGVLPGSMQDFVVNVGDRVYFDLDQSSVRTDAMSMLDAQAAWLLRYPSVMVRIEGNADERGTREYNFALGARRAESVKSYLMSRGVPASRISTISYGKENPIATGSDEDSWAQNRNAHTAITSGAK